MRTPLWYLLLAFALAGCRSQPKDPRQNFPLPKQSNVPTVTEPIITIAGPSRGRVASVNQSARFVVLRFPIGFMPAIDRRFSVYRQGLKVGELRVSGPQYDNNTVADIIAGNCRVGDEARED
jgi:hypothetical protein